MPKVDYEYDNRAGPDRYEEKKQKPQWIKMIILAVMCLVAVQSATQFVAYTFEYQEALGEPLFDTFYAPTKIIEWSTYWSDDYPDVFENAYYIGFGIICLTMLILAIPKIMDQMKLKGNKYLHGSARWSNEKDMLDAGLLHKEPDKYIFNWKDKKGKLHHLFKWQTGKYFDLTGASVVVGAIRDRNNKFHYLTHGGPEHILTFAPTRSGKGVGLVVPTMLTWTESVVANDIKGELWALTAGYRQQGFKNKCIKLEFASENSAHWNPLDEIRIGTDYEVGDAQNLASMIVDPDGKGMDGQDGHWKKTAFALYTGLIIYLIYEIKNPNSVYNTDPYYTSKKLKANFATLDFILSDKQKPIKELWNMMKEHHNQVVSSAGQDMLDKPDEEAGSVLSTVKSNLSLYRDPIVAKNVEDSTFSIRDLMHCKQAVSLYLVSQPSDKGRIRPILRIFVVMCMRLLADKMEFKHGRAVKTYQHRLLMMLDEFPALGKMEVVQESLAFVAGYGIKCYLITQDLGQLYTAYGKDESVTSNCHIQNCFPAIKDDTCDYISRMTGDTTIVRETKSRSGSGLKASFTTSIQETQRRLLTSGEVKSLQGSVKNEQGMIEKAGKMLIFSAGHPPIFGEQPLYFFDDNFNKNSSYEPPEYSDFVTDEDRVFEETKPKKSKIDDQIVVESDVFINEKKLKFEKIEKQIKEILQAIQQLKDEINQYEKAKSELENGKSDTTDETTSTAGGNSQELIDSYQVKIVESNQKIAQLEEAIKKLQKELEAVKKEIDEVEKRENNKDLVTVSSLNQSQGQKL